MHSRSLLRWAPMPILALPLLACDLTPAPQPALPPAPSSSASRVAPEATLPQLVRQLAQARGMVPLPAPPAVRPALARLGQALAFDRVLSGNRDIACSTCHLPSFGTGDGRSLSVGQGAVGFGPGRTHARSQFIPRNA